MAAQRPYEKQHHHTQIDGKGHAKVELLADGPSKWGILSWRSQGVDPPNGAGSRQGITKIR